jgi:hypothetical protein
MVSILAFDSKAIKSLLSEKYLEFQDKEYPLIYKNKKQAVRIEKGKKITKNTYYSALDVALDNNQIRAIEIMIKYIIEYQNNYVSYFLFKDNLIELMNRGIELTQLLKSNVFLYRFEFDEWPEAHSNCDRHIMPYNGSIFDLRN